MRWKHIRRETLRDAQEKSVKTQADKVDLAENGHSFPSGSRTEGS